MATAEWPEEQEIVLTKEPDDKLGMDLGDMAGLQMMLKQVFPNTCAERCGAAEYVGWQLVRVNGAPVGLPAHVAGHAKDATELRVRFARTNVDLAKPLTPDAAGTAVPLVRRDLAAELAADAALERWCDDRMVRRFIAGNVYNRPTDAAKAQIAAAVTQLRGTLQWRVATRPEQMSCGRCAKDPTTHCMRVVGQDTGGRAVSMSCFAQATFRTDVEANIQHMLWAMEECVRVMDESGRGAEQWVMITDFHGYSMMTDGSPSSAKRTGELLTHYPERLGRCIMVDAGVLFEATWAIVSKIINARTASKISFIKYAQLRAELEQFCDPELTEWIATECADNRARKPASPKKDGKRWWVAPSDGGEHDARGTASFIQTLYRPAPWLPA